MSEKYKIPKESWFVPFGPIRDVDLVKVSALRAFRESTGAKYSHGTLMRKMEISFENSNRATSQIFEMRENCVYFLRGRPDSDSAEKPATLFIERDGAIIAIMTVHRQDWQVVS